MAEQMLPEVEYREVVGFPGYRVGSDGTVWSNMRGGDFRLLRQQVANGGYMRAYIYNPDGKQLPKMVHRLVLEAFVGPCPEGMEACHFPDRNRTNNCVDNLRWDTRKANCKDKATHGTQTHGEMMPWHRLTESQVEQIRLAYAAGTKSPTLSKQYGVSTENIAAIVGGRIWKRAAGPIVIGNLRPPKLTDEQVREIRRRQPTEGTRKIASEFGVAENTIVYIMLGKRRANAGQERTEAVA
jgi:hypothetical protein